MEVFLLFHLKMRKQEKKNRHPSLLGRGDKTNLYMVKLKIGIIEDEMVIANTIAVILRHLDYETTSVADSYNTAVKMMEEEKPDLVLVDIILKGKKDGIDVANYIRDKYSTPIIFLTANSDMTTVQRAKAAKPNAYLLKPFSKADLYAAIEIAMSNHLATDNMDKDTLLVKDGYGFVKVFLKEIQFITSHQNYVTLTLTTKKRIMIRSTLTEIELKLDNQQFLKINRGNIVNKNCVTKIETNKVFIGSQEFTVIKAQRNLLISLLQKEE